MEKCQVPHKKSDISIEMKHASVVIPQHYSGIKERETGFIHSR